MDSSPQAWEQQPERSTPWALALLVWIARTLGRGVGRLILAPTALYFLLFSAGARRSSRGFLRRVLGREPRWSEVWRHLFTFAAVTLDRVLVLAGAGHGLDVQLGDVQPAIDAARGRGCLVLAAHFGSFEVIRGPARDYGLPLSILLDRAQGRMFTDLLERLDPDFARSVIDASERGPTLVLRIKEALDRATMVGIMADRVRAGERAVDVSFLGAPAQLPATPWILAAGLGVPVLVAFCAYRGGRRYDARFELFAQRVELPREGRETALRGYAQRYADRLEQQVRAAPYNWFNFYDFWAGAPPP